MPKPIALLVERAGEKLKAGRNKALVADARIAGKRVVLAFPTTYMNESGQAVGALMRRHKITDPQQLIVVHDELDLPPGIVRVKVGGGLAGNNGLRSITQHLKTQDYTRVRIGIGKPPSKERGADHVLSRLPKAERELLDVVDRRSPPTRSRCCSPRAPTRRCESSTARTVSPSRSAMSIRQACRMTTVTRQSGLSATATLNSQDVARFTRLASSSASGRHRPDAGIRQPRGSRRRARNRARRHGCRARPTG